MLSKGDTPNWDRDTWTFTVTGAVDTELSLSYDEFRALDTVTQRQDFHCVTGWSKLDCEFTGVPFPELAAAAGVTDDAVHVLFHALDGYTTNLPLADCMREEVLFTWAFDDDPLPPNTAARCASSPHTSTRTRAQSGWTASNSSRSPSAATGRSAATRTPPTRGPKTATVRPGQQGISPSSANR